LRRIRKGESEELLERLKRAKGIQAEQTERLRLMRDQVVQRDSDLQGLTQEYNRL
jgi:hypothetical protein